MELQTSNTVMTDTRGNTSQSINHVTASSHQTAHIQDETKDTIPSISPKYRHIEQTKQMDGAMVLPEQPNNWPEWVRDPAFVCQRCSSLPGFIWSLFDSYLRELPIRSLPIETLANSQCKVCRLLGTTLSLYRPGNETSRLFYSGNFADHLPVHGAYTLTPRFDSHDHYKARIPIFHLISSEKEVLENALPKLYPKEINYERIKSWIRECDAAPTLSPQTHQKCGRDLRHTLRSLKVIDCKTMHIIAAPPGCDYVALSYVWGQSIGAGRPDESGLLPDLPLTIRDSIAVALSLGYMYIWIDRYCIDQIDSEDKHRQIQQMGAIYSSAGLTIFVSCAGDLSTGLPGVSRKRKGITQYESLESMVLISHQTDAIADIQMSAWATRAWTFQEGYLSKRRLYFTDNQVVFICNERVRLEVAGREELHRVYLGALGKSLPHYRENRGYAGQMEIGRTMLEEFTKRNLSYDSDALDAIAGALNTLDSQPFPTRHIWGLPFASHDKDLETSNISVALHWYHPDPVVRRAGFPSWSPLGWRGPAVFFGYEQPETPSDCIIKVLTGGTYQELGSLAEYKTSAATCTASTQCLQINAPVIQLPLFRDPKHPHPLVVFPWLNRSNRKSEQLDAYLEPKWDSEPSKQDSVTCAFLTKGRHSWTYLRSSIIGLLLTNHGSHYERVGCLVYPRGVGPRDDHCTSEVLTKGPRGTLECRSPSDLKLSKRNKYDPLWLQKIETKTIVLR